MMSSKKREWSSVRPISMALLVLLVMTSAQSVRADWLIKTYRNGNAVNNLSDADRLITNTLPIATGVIQEADLLGFSTGEGTGHFSINAPVPGITQAQATDNYAVQGTGFLVVPAAGTYTFGLNTDDGARLRLDGVDVIVDDSIHPPRDSTYATIGLTTGLHPIEWTWFNAGGGAEGEAFAASGQSTSFNTNFTLLGDPNGLPVISTLRPYINTQPASQFVQAESSATFSVAANGQPPLYFQWHFNDSDIPNATNVTLTLNSVSVGSTGFYSVTVSNSVGSIDSIAASLNVYPAGIAQGWTINTYRDGSSVNGLADADRLITNTLPIATGVIQEADLLGFSTGEGTGHFSINAPVPGITQTQATDNYAVQGTGFLVVPTTGIYTFGLNTDDGGRLRIDGTSVIVDDVRSPPHDSAFVPVFLAAGIHAVEWTWYNEAGGANGGGAEGEAFVAPGVHTSFDSSFDLLGDTNGLSVVPWVLLGAIAQTLPPTAVTSSSAYLHGVINPNGSSTTAYFEYGATTAYGSTTPAGNFGTNAQDIGFVLTSLAPATTYHCRITAFNASGTTWGNDIQFTTLPISTTATQAWVAGTSGLGLRLRSAPSLSAPVILVMPEGSSVTLLGDTQTADGYLWRDVTYGTQTGWAAAQYLLFTPGTPPTPPAAPITLRQ
jgi:hypothetical protein